MADTMGPASLAERLRGLPGRLRPVFVVDAVVNLTPEDIGRHAPGIRAVLLDIDGTITDHHAPTVPESAARRLAGYTEAGLATFIISNCHDERVDEVHRLFGPLVTGVITPVDAVDPADPRDRPRRHIKPAPDMLLAVVERHQVTDPDGSRRPLTAREMLMVGDQMIKDVLAARRAGASSVLVRAKDARTIRASGSSSVRSRCCCARCWGCRYGAAPGPTGSPRWPDDGAFRPVSAPGRGTSTGRAFSRARGRC